MWPPKPSQFVYSEGGEHKENVWGIATSYGANTYQHDRYGVSILNEGCALFYCFDGHTTERVVNRAQKELPQWIGDSINNYRNKCIGDDWANKSLSDYEAMQIKQAIIEAIVKYDSERICELKIIGGTTFVGLLQTKSHFFVINLGDSQLRILASKTNETIFKTKLHSLSDPVELERVKSATSFSLSEQRVSNSDGITADFRYVVNPKNNHKISVPRTIGDKEFKVKNPRSRVYEYDGNTSPLIAVAEVQIIKKSAYSKEIYGDLYAFLFSDGIGDLIEFGQKYPNVSALPKHWKMNLMDKEPQMSALRMGIVPKMIRWAEEIVTLMARPIYRQEHDNMGMLITKLS